MVERSLSMREVRGSIPRISIFNSIFFVNGPMSFVERPAKSIILQMLFCTLIYSTLSVLQTIKNFFSLNQDFKTRLYCDVKFLQVGEEEIAQQTMNINKMERDIGDIGGLEKPWPWACLRSITWILGSHSHSQHRWKFIQYNCFRWGLLMLQGLSNWSCVLAE